MIAMLELTLLVASLVLSLGVTIVLLNGNVRPGRKVGRGPSLTDGPDAASNDHRPHAQHYERMSQDA